MAALLARPDSLDIENRNYYHIIILLLSKIAIIIILGDMPGPACWLDLTAWDLGSARAEEFILIIFSLSLRMQTPDHRTTTSSRCFKS